jgi:hypothetical protein
MDIFTGGADNFTFEKSRGAWVVWDNDTGTAEMIKQLHPSDHVLLFNPDTQRYTPYYTEYESKTIAPSIGKNINIITTTEKI